MIRLKRRLRLFGSFSKQDEAALDGITADIIDLTSGVDLVCEGATLESPFIVLEGFVARYKLSIAGSRQIVAYLLPGDLSDFSPPMVRHADHNIGTLSTCQVARIEAETMFALQRRPAIARAMQLAAYQDLANAREWQVNCRRRAVSRVGHLFCELLMRLEMVGLADVNSYDLPLTQIDLADTLGMSTVHLNRSLQDLKKAKLLTVRGKNVVILDFPQLKKRSGFRPDYLQLNQSLVAY